MKKVLYILPLLMLLIGCAGGDQNINTDQLNTTKNNDPVITADNIRQKEVIEKPFENIDVEFTTYKYNSRKGKTIELPTGTQIDIPKNAFVDKDGNPVKGSVDIKYREFHDVDDIILSGIKMSTPDGNFESAGMFEIRAEKDGEQLELKDGKSIGVELASYKSGDFNNYAMNEETKEWEFINQSAAEPNTRKTDKLNSIDSSELVLEEPCDFKPGEISDGDEVFDLDYSLNRHYEMNFFNGAMWRIEGDETEINRFKNDRKRYNEMTVMPSDSCTTFELTLWNRESLVEDKNKTKYTVVPVWKGSALDRAKVNFKERMQQYKNTVIKLAQERRAAEREADLIRKFELEGMGIYNCDRILDFIDMRPLALNIKCDEPVKNWWYITMNKKVAIKYYKQEVPDFRYNPNSTNSVMAILPNDKVAMITNEQFVAAYDDYRVSDDPNKVMELELQIEPEPVAEKKEFKRHFSRF